MRSSSSTSSSSLIRAPLLLLVVLLLTTLCQADKDSNIYPWGENPNTHFKMYWKDAANVIQDLDQFQALYVQVHGCVWSECAGADNFDDDGENHDGDEEWYLTRTTTFCANAAYSLYGIKKNNFKLVNTCSKGTYINSFFTYGGADTLARALGLNVNTKDNNRYSAVDDDTYGGTSNSDCVAVEANGRFLRDVVEGGARRLGQGERELSDSGDSGDGEDDWDNEDQYDTSSVVSTTMGCAASATSKYNKFVLAGFDDEYCSGQHYVETVGTLNAYNKALHKVSCTRIWDLGSYNRNQRSSNNNNNNYNDDANGDDGQRQLNMEDDLMMMDEQEENQDQDQDQNRELNENNNNNNNNGAYKRTYNSVAEHLLYHSWACDLSLYPNQCPDPYGLKRKYFNVMKAAANGQPINIAIMNAKLRKPLKILTILFMLMGLYLWCFAYWLKNKSYIANHGGGARGLWATLQRDIFAAHVAIQAKVQKARERHFQNRNQSSSKSSRRSSKKDRGVWATLFGKNKKKKKKKRRSSSRRDRDRQLQRTPSGRSVREEFSDEDERSQYTEMTDEHLASSQRSGRSSRKTSANYSSSRTSKAAEAAFAAAAQFDLEQQAGGGGSGGIGGSGGHQPSSNSHHHHPSILPSNSSNLEGGGGRSHRSSRSRTRSAHRHPSSKSRSRSHSQRRHQTSASGMDPSPTRSPGGTSVRRSHWRGGGTSKSPERRVFV